jgi:peptidyl-prolyl cis-trans isomerase D
VRDAAFNIEVLEQELNSEVIAVDADRSVVLRVLEHTEAQIRPLDVVNGEVELLVRQEKAKQQAEALGKTFIDGLQTNGNIDGLLSTQGLSWNQVDSIERVAANVNPELTDKAFAMARPEVGKTTVDGFSLGNGDYAIIEVQSVTDGTAADFKEGEEASIRNFVSQQSGSTDITSFIRSLEARAAIEGKETQLEVQDPLL